MNPQPRPQDDDRDGNERDGNDRDELYTLNEVAKLLQIPPATLRYWRNRGIGPHSFRLGRHVRYHPADVNAWLQHLRNADSPDAA